MPWQYQNEPYSAYEIHEAYAASLAFGKTLVNNRVNNRERIAL